MIELSRKPRGPIPVFCSIHAQTPHPPRLSIPTLPPARRSATYAMMESRTSREAKHLAGRRRVDFVTVVDQAITLLRQRGRLTYRTLQFQFQLDDAHLEALKDELIEGQRLAVDEGGRVLVWTGDTATPGLPRLVTVSFTYMRSEADLTPYVPTQRAAIVAWTKLCVLDAAASEDDRRPRPLGGSVGSGRAAGRQSG